MAGLRAAVAGLGLVLVPVLVVWLDADGAVSAPTTGTGDGWFAPVRAGGVAWLIAHGAHLRVPTTIDVVPLGLTALAVLLVAISGRRVGAALRARRPRPAPAVRASALGGVVLGYLVVTLVVLGLSTTPAAVVPVVPAAVGASLVALVGAVPVVLGRVGLVDLLRALALSSAGQGARSRVPAPWRRAGREALARGWLTRAPRAALTAAGALFAAGAAVVVWALVRRGADVLALTGALEPGPVGAVVLVLVQLALLPVAAVWALAWLAGPGFAVGTGTSVTLGGAQLGALPALPVLAALEDLPSAAPPLTWALVVVPVLAGVLAGAVVLRGRATSVDLEAAPASVATTVRAGALAVLVVTVLVALVVGALAAAASGGAGPGRMAVVGPAPWLTAGAVSAEVLLGAALVVLPAARRRAREREVS